ncbi:MAG TPA: XdhC/CoxI family protein [Candidatus Limnocylindria bacterium]|jgi:xanthine dehydrogenase accessory factor
MDARAAVREALARGERAALVTITALEGSPPSKDDMALAVLEGGARFGSLGCDGFDESAEHDALRALRERIRLERTYDWDESSRIRVDVRPFEPGERVPGSTARPELVVVGAGPVARALSALGHVLGFQLRVISLGASDAVDADERRELTSAAELSGIEAGPETFVVIAGHDREFSQQALRRFVATEAPYVGMMGSRRHTGGLRDELRAEGHDDTAIAKIHTPVGLDLGAQTPEEIALAALAHIVAVRRGRNGSPLA